MLGGGAQSPADSVSNNELSSGDERTRLLSAEHPPSGQSVASAEIANGDDIVNTNGSRNEVKPSLEEGLPADADVLRKKPSPDSDDDILETHADKSGSCGLECCQVVALDLVCWVVFIFVLVFLPIPNLDLKDKSTSYYYGVLGASDRMAMGILGILVVLMIVWRLARASKQEQDAQGGHVLPYTCGYAAKDGKEIILVATLHISPRAPRDVEAVIEGVRPDLVMIELDEERLDRMREGRRGKGREQHPPEGPEAGDLENTGNKEQEGREVQGQEGTDVQQQPPVPPPLPEGMQPITIRRPGKPELETLAQRAIWNGEFGGDTIRGELTFDEANPYGMEAVTQPKGGNSSSSSGSSSKIALVQRGSKGGEFAPFALKAHNLAPGADALFIVNNVDRLPSQRLGAGTLSTDLQIAFRTRSCGLPPIPTLLLPKDVGNELKDALTLNNEAIQVEFNVNHDNYPRRGLKFKLCQLLAFIFSGIGVLYCVIQSFRVTVGAEFTAAEAAAAAQRIACRCIDVNMDDFWWRLLMGLLPTPCNLWDSLLSWLAFPRVFFRMLFPQAKSVDVLGTATLHCKSLSCWTWVAFFVAVTAANFVTSKVLQLLAAGAVQGGEAVGAVSEKDSQDANEYIMLLIELHVLTAFYRVVLASRDEAMYCGIIKECSRTEAKSAVVVLGAAHSNGVLQRIHTRGFW